MVVHRQLLAALQAQGAAAAGETSGPSAGPLSLVSEEPRAPAPPLSPAAVMMDHSELCRAAAAMNERHRAAKAAQKQCTELFMLDLLHKRPHVESALVVAIEVWGELGGDVRRWGEVRRRWGRGGGRLCRAPGAVMGCIKWASIAWQ